MQQVWVRRKRCRTFREETFRKKNLENLDVEEGIKLKWILGMGSGAYIGIFWLIMDTVIGSCKNGNEVSCYTNAKVS